MKFFSKITFICNICFLAQAALHIIDFKRNAAGKSDLVITLPWIEGIIAILGLVAIIINILYCIVALVLLITKKKFPNPVWIGIFNLIILLIQFYWFFIDKSK